MDNNLRIEENNTKRWFGEYKGLRFEINNFTNKGIDSLGIRPSECWTYYLLINLNRVASSEVSKSLWIEPSKDYKDRVFYRYSDVDEINNIDFHGGCTFYSKVSGFDGSDKVVKIGCDYQHLWDEGIIYSYDDVLNDVKNSINSFLRISNIKYWCNGNGNLYDLSEGKLIKGVFYSEDYFGDRQIYKNN